MMTQHSPKRVTQEMMKRKKMKDGRLDEMNGKPSEMKFNDLFERLKAN